MSLYLTDMTNFIFLRDRHTLNGILLEKNTEFLTALKEKRPIKEVKTLQSEIQEIYIPLDAYKRQSMA